MTDALRGQRVLVVEDEVIVAWNLEDMLVELGCVVVGPASRLGVALTMIDTQAIDMALLDVNLDGRPSYPLADALAARGVPFAFSTGYDKPGLADEYRTIPVLQKPFRRSELGEVLGDLMASRDCKVTLLRDDAEEALS